jgi:hypothetical protein
VCSGAQKARARFNGVSGMTDSVSKSPADHLHCLRESWLLSDEAKMVLNGNEISHSSNCTIGSETWNQEIYSDFSGIKKFIVFEMSRNKILGKEHHCLGCEIVQDKYSLITNEQLWKEGIP